jgi:hypothetical protein
MSQRSFWRVLLISIVCVALATPATAGTLDNNARNIVIGIVAATAAVAVVVTVVVIHYSRKRTITGCVNAGASGMTITDERDQRVYAVSGNTAGVAPGERMKLRGQRLKSRGADKTHTWVATEVAKDFGVCRP